MATVLTAKPSLPLAPSYTSSGVEQEEKSISVLLTSFAGLGLPRTLSLPAKSSTTVHDVLEIINSRLPRVDHVLIITTTSNKQLLPSNHEPISTLLSSQDDTFLPLRLSARLCGGKGGFGSQLRAAGGRMSSRKNKNQNQNPNGSNRNLDGRRLRTVDEAKRLAELLATKPGAEKKEKDLKKKRWQEVVDNAEKRKEEIQSGKLGAGQGRLNAEYVESKELAEGKTREAVMKAMREGLLEAERTGSESSMEADGDGSDEDEDAEEGSSASSEEAKLQMTQNSAPTYYGWDDEDEDSGDESADENHPAPTTYEGKGKEKAA